MAVTLEDGGHILVGRFSGCLPICNYAFMNYAVDFKVEQRITRSSKSCGVVPEEFDAMNGGYVVDDPAA